MCVLYTEFLSHVSNYYNYTLLLYLFSQKNFGKWDINKYTYSLIEIKVKKIITMHYIYNLY